METPHSGRPRRKLLVPSIGSTTQHRSPAPPPLSSPRKPSAGKASVRRVRIKDSTSRSAMLTKSCGPLVSRVRSSRRAKCLAASFGRARAFQPHARAKKLPRAAECPVYSLTPSGVLAENHPKNRGFVGILRGQKCLRRRFLRRSPVGEWSRGARSMPRVLGRGSRIQPAALVSDRDDAALFPAIRILEGYGSATARRKLFARSFAAMRNSAVRLLKDELEARRP